MLGGGVDHGGAGFSEEFPDPPITQQLTVIYGLSQVHTRIQKWVTRRINFGNFEEQCDPVTACDQPFEPWLYRVDSGKVAEGMVLPEAAIAHEIVVRKRPVIIRWNYEKVRETRPEECRRGLCCRGGSAQGRAFADHHGL